MLRQRRLEVFQARTSEDALQAWQDEIPDLIVIDAPCVQVDPVALCRQIRAESVIPLLLLLQAQNEEKILDAYRAGADEVIIKPVSPAMFLAKINAWLRRTWTIPAEALETLNVGELSLDPARRKVFLAGGDSVKLTNLEFRLLHVLMAHPGWVLESDSLVERVWGYSGDGDKTLLKNVVYRLRRKLESDPARPRYILTEPGAGYKFRAG